MALVQVVESHDENALLCRVPMAMINGLQVLI